MIERKDLKMANFFTEGFDTSLNAMDIAFGEGSLNIYVNTLTLDYKAATELETHNIPSFEFTCLSDENFKKRYDVFIIRDSNDVMTVDVQSTLYTDFSIPIYEDNPIVHHLAFIELQPNETDLNNAHIEIYNVILEGSV